MASNSSSKNVFQFKISLKYLKPKIWRQIQVPANYTFQQLHWAIQDSMGWKSYCLNYHLHVFRMKRPLSGENVEIGIPNDRYDFDETIPEERTKLEDYFKATKTKALYEYDFGDSWEHEVVLEKILPALEGSAYPKCIAGKRACPPEDIGGSEGYEELLESNTVGSDPEEFDPNSVIFHGGKMVNTSL